MSEAIDPNIRGYQLAGRLKIEADEVARDDRRELFLKAAREIEALVGENRYLRGQLEKERRTQGKEAEG